MVAIAVAGLIVAASTGGSLRRLSDLHLARSWLIFGGLGLQVLVTVVLPDHSPGTSEFVHLISYTFVVAFLGSNRHLPGMRLVLLGTVLNLAAIGANHGTMPALESAQRRAGIVADRAFENSAPVRDANLQVLGDVFAVPAGMPFANVFSIGDVLIDLGAVVLVVATCKRPGRHYRVPGTRSAPGVIPRPESAQSSEQVAGA